MKYYRKTSIFVKPVFIGITRFRFHCLTSLNIRAEPEWNGPAQHSMFVEGTWFDFEPVLLHCPWFSSSKFRVRLPTLKHEMAASSHSS
jgi:hypothetical protein